MILNNVIEIIAFFNELSFSLTEKKQLLKFQQFQQDVLVVSWWRDEISFVSGDVVNDTFILSWCGLNQNNGEDHQECLRDRFMRFITI